MHVVSILPSYSQCTHTILPHVYTLSLHDALPISSGNSGGANSHAAASAAGGFDRLPAPLSDRKSTRLNSSHRCISYAVFCLEKKMSVKWGSRCILYSELSISERDIVSS